MGHLTMSDVTQFWHRVLFYMIEQIKRKSHMNFRAVFFLGQPNVYVSLITYVIGVYLSVI